MISWRARAEAVFERVASSQDLADVLAVLTAGAPVTLDPARVATGPGAGWVMLPYLRLGASRFSDGQRYGVFYAGHHRPTAIAETIFHFARFLAASREAATLLGARLLRCWVAGTMVDIRGERNARPELYDPDPGHYGPAQRWADRLQRDNLAGIVYDSVRDPAGQCVAVFDPRCVTRCGVEAALSYEWDGTAIVAAHRMREIWRP